MAISSTLVEAGYTGLLPNSAADPQNDPAVYTVPTNKQYAITTILFCNTGIADPDTPDSDLTYLDLHIVKSGDALGAGNMVLNNIPIPGGETFTFDTEKIILEEGDAIYAATTSPTVITSTLSYLEV